MRIRLTAAAIAFAALASQPAAAGQYEVHSCRLPDGTPIQAVGWLGDFGGGDWFRSDDSCGGGGALTAALMGVPTYAHPPGAYSRWRLAAPPATAIRRLRGHAAFATAEGQPYGSPIVEAEGDEAQGRFGISYGERRGSFARWDAPGNGFDTGVMTPTRGFRMAVRCVGGGASCPPPGDDGGDTALAQLFRAQTTFEDLSDPVVARIAGRLVEPGVHRGVEHLHVEAADTGSGVYRLIVELDGQERLRQVVDRNAGQCADAYTANVSERDFTVPVPCKLEVNGGETLDTRLLPDGEHRLRLLVEDAAGNRRVAGGPIEGWTVRNLPIPQPPPASVSPPMAGSNGVPATERSRLELFFVTARTRRQCHRAVGAHGQIRRRCRRVRTGLSTRREAVVRMAYGQRALLAGRLMTLGGTPIRGARLHLRRLRRGTRRAFERFDVRTDSGGRFRTELGRSPSERIRVAYYATSSTRRPVLSRTLTRLVRAGVALSPSRRTLPRGGRVVLRGRLHGERRPRSGVLAIAEVLLRGRWTAFAERRVGPSGRFRASGRFHRPGRYSLRVRVPRAAGYPYEPSISRKVRVRVR